MSTAIDGIFALGSTRKASWDVQSLYAPHYLFPLGENGALYDPSDFSTLLQDTAGTIPCTAAGQYVGMIRDKSGNGHHAIAPSDAARPTIERDANGFWYLDFNGTSQYLLTTKTLDLTHTAEVTMWAAFLFRSETSQDATIIGQAVVADGVLVIRCNYGTPRIQAGLGGSDDPANKFANWNSADLVNPQIAILRGNVNTPLLQLTHKNAIIQNTGSMGGPPLNNKAIALGARIDGASFANCRLYTAGVVDRQITSDEHMLLRSYIGGLVGV